MRVSLRMNSSKLGRTFLHVAIIVFAVLLLAGVNLLPTFPVAAGLQKSPDSRPFDLVLKFDKFVLGCLVLWSLGSMKGRAFYGVKSESLASLFWLTLSCSGVLMVPALVAHYVRFDPGVSEFAWVWAFINLFLVSFGEEAFFRSYLIENLRRTKFFQKRTTALVLLTSLLFGVAHYRGGLTYVALASIAGVFYGSSYLRTGLFGSIIVHFLVNSIHFVGFSYPALLKGH